MASCEFCNLSDTLSSELCPPQSSQVSKKIPAQENETRLKQKEEIDVLVKAVEDTANKFSPKFARYYRSNCTNPSLPRNMKSRKPAIVPKIFYTMWRLLLAPEERSSAKPRTVPVPFPVVDWQALARPTWKDRIGLPCPATLPLHSCSQDPSFYQPSSEKDLQQRILPLMSSFPLERFLGI